MAYGIDAWHVTRVWSATWSPSRVRYFPIDHAFPTFEPVEPRSLTPQCSLMSETALEAPNSFLWISAHERQGAPEVYPHMYPHRV